MKFEFMLNLKNWQSWFWCHLAQFGQCSATIYFKYDLKFLKFWLGLASEEHMMKIEGLNYYKDERKNTTRMHKDRNLVL